MTDEAMDCEDSCDFDHMDSHTPPDTPAAEPLRSCPETVVVVPNAFDPQPMTIHQLAYQAEGNLLAVSRYARKIPVPEGSKVAIEEPVGKIEIWGTRPLYRLKQSIYLPGEFSSIESLHWYKGRLFSCGIHGHLVEYDIKNEKIKKWTSVVGGIKWCMAIDNATGRIAIGSEDGFVAIMQIYDYDIETDQILDRQEDRVLCISWSPDGTKLATGSPNAVRIWDVKSGQAVDRISLGQTRAKDDTIVWCISFIDNFTFATGDSKGRVCIWDAKMGVCSEIHETKSQQVQCLATIENKIYCAGVGKSIQVLMKSKDDLSNKWVIGATRTCHTHDVRALVAVTSSELVSGGVDSYMIVSKAPPLSVNVIPPYHSSDILTAPSKNLFMVRYINHTEVLQLPPNSHLVNKIFQFNTSSPLTTIGISDDGNWCALSTLKNSKIFALVWPFKKAVEASAESIMLPSSHYKAFKRITFSDPSQMAAVVTKDNKIRCLLLLHEIKAVTETYIVDVASVLSPRSTVNLMKFSEHHLILSDFDGNVALKHASEEMSKKSDWKLLPKNSHELTAMALQNTVKNKILLFYSDGQISELAIEGFSYKILQPNSEGQKLHGTGVTGNSLTTVCSHLTKKGYFMSVDGGKLLGFNYFNMLLQKQGKGSKRYPPMTESNLGKFLVNITQNSNGDICVVRASHERLLEKLPPMPFAKTFGTQLM
ncbi:U3 small nucleolar RNA-associated protein 4 homolog [Neocloeon triangulifer]|uniref:U3 small nucleolar RNA-associated protein 4 homolog n=1 Tax=Neocloeon triangulifer TaxID=2078957 RepID=UPI00286F6BE5|nr:U3 small nucleolar RNA-associated protein 4 homolog [Neocloeon triangulifer]